MKTRCRVRVAATLAIAVFLLSACGKKYEQLAEKPPRQTSPAPDSSSESQIAINILFPYEVLSNALTTALPDKVPLSGRQHICVDVEEQVQKQVQEAIGGDVGKFIGQVARIVTTTVTVGQVRNVCGDLDYEATIRRDGGATVNPAANNLRISVPISVDGHAGFAGDLAKVLALDKKNFRGAISAFVDLALSVDRNWCPSVTATPDFVWRDKAQLEVAGKFWIDVDGQAGPALKNTMQDAASKLPQTITCDKVKDLVQPIWKSYDIALPDVLGQPGHVVVTPTKAGFSGLSYTPEGVQMAMMLTAKTAVSVGTPPPAPPEATLALPLLETVATQGNQFNITLPVRVPYESFRKAISQSLVGKTFTGVSNAASASVTVEDVDVYPDSDRLVTGIRFSSKVSKPESIAPKGWVYVIAKPHFDTASQVLSVQEVEFSRIIDNDVWNVLSFLFQEQIRQAITEHAQVDLRPQIAAARKSMRSVLASEAAKDGINVGLSEDFLGLNGIALTETGIEAVVGFRGAANITFLNKKIAR